MRQELAHWRFLHELTAGAEDSRHFGKRRFGPGDVKAGSEINDEVEGRVRERQISRVARDQFRWNPRLIEAVPSLGQVAWLDVETGEPHRREQPGQRDERDSAATADLEHPNVPWQSKGADKAGHFERLLASVASFLIWKRLVLAVAGRY